MYSSAWIGLLRAHSHEFVRTCSDGWLGRRGWFRCCGGGGLLLFQASSKQERG